MAFKVNEVESSDQWVESEERLWLTADGESLVGEGDPAAASLFASPGKRISREDAERFGLVKARGKQVDKQRVPEADKQQEESAPDPDPVPAKRRSRRKG